MPVVIGKVGGCFDDLVHRYDRSSVVNRHIFHGCAFQFLDRPLENKSWRQRFGIFVKTGWHACLPQLRGRAGGFTGVSSAGFGSA